MGGAVGLGETEGTIEVVGACEGAVDVDGAGVVLGRYEGANEGRKVGKGVGWRVGALNTLAPSRRLNKMLTRSTRSHLDVKHGHIFFSPPFF